MPDRNTTQPGDLHQMVAAYFDGKITAYETAELLTAIRRKPAALLEQLAPIITPALRMQEYEQGLEYECEDLQEQIYSDHIPNCSFRTTGESCSYDCDLEMDRTHRECVDLWVREGTVYHRVDVFQTAEGAHSTGRIISSDNDYFVAEHRCLTANRDGNFQFKATGRWQ